MIKNRSTLQLRDITETKQRMGTREISEAKLKQVSGGLIASGGGTCTACDDCDD